MSANKNTTWGLFLIIFLLFGALFWQEKTNKQDTELNSISQITNILVEEKLFQQALKQITFSTLKVPSQKLEPLKKYVHQNAKKYLDETCSKIKKNWPLLSVDDKYKKIIFLKILKKNQLNEQIILIDDILKDLQSSMVKIDKKVEVEKVKNLDNIIKRVNFEKIKTKQLLPIKEQLKKDWEELLAKETPSIKGKLKKAEYALTSNKKRRLYYYARAPILYEIRSKALVPLLLLHMYENKSQKDRFLTPMAVIITILTGKKIKFTRQQSSQELDDLINNWWFLKKDSISTKYISLSRDQKDRIIKNILNLHSNFFRSSYQLRTKDPKHLDRIFRIFKRTSHPYRKIPLVKCTKDMIPEFLEQAESEKSWYLVNIFSQLYKEGNFPNLTKIISEAKYTTSTKFIAILSLWKSGKNIDAKNLLSLIDKEPNASKKNIMIITLQYSNDISQILPKLLKKLDEQDISVKKSIFYALKNFTPTKSQRFIFTPYLVEIEKIFSFSLQDKYIIDVLANIGSKPAIDVLVTYLEKIHKNLDKSRLMESVLQSIKKATNATWKIDKYYEERYNISKYVINNWRGIKTSQIDNKNLGIEQVQWLQEKKTGNVLHVDSKKEKEKNTYPRLSTALRNAKPGDTIKLAAGIYNEIILLPVGVTLDGKSPSDVKIRGSVQLSSTSVLQNVTIEMSSPAIKIENVKGALVRNCWIKYAGISSRTNHSEAININNSTDVILLQNVVYDVSGKDAGDVCGILFKNSTGAIVNNIIGHIISSSSSAYGIFISDSNNVSIYNNTIAFVNADKRNAYGIYINSLSSCSTKNNIVYTTKGRESYGIVNQSNSSKITYNAGNKANVLYIGEANNNYSQNPNFINGLNGDFTLQPDSLYLNNANINAKISISTPSNEEFINEMGAFGGYFPLTKKHTAKLKQFSPKSSKTGRYARGRFDNQNIWSSNNYVYRSIRRALLGLKDIRRNPLSKRTIKRYPYYAIEALNDIINNRAPREYKELKPEAIKLMAEIKKERSIGSWGFGG